MKINHMSVSRAENYERCPQSYLYRYHLDILPKVQKFHFTYGKIVHKIIEVYTTERGKRDINEVSKSVLAGDVIIENNEVAPELDYEHKARLAANLHHFMRLTEKVGVEGEVEWAFNLDLDPPNKRCWVGFIDRLIQKDNKFFVIDYKTTKPGKWRKDRISIRKDLQIQGYCYIVKNHFNVPAENVRAALYYLEDGLLVDSGHFSEETLGNVPKNLLELYKKIENQEATQVIGKVGDHCYQCDYNNICPFYKQFRTGFRMGNHR